MISFIEVDCPPLIERPNLVASTDATMLGTRVQFTCKDSNFLNGAQEVVCQATGSWSAPPPKCESKCENFSCQYLLKPLCNVPCRFLY